MKMTSPAPKLIAILLVALGAFAILYYYWIAAGGTPAFQAKQYTITATIQDPQGLLKHADVRAAGLKIGQVSNITNTSAEQGTQALVQMQLDKDFAPVYKNATVLVRQKTLVGENYIQISRGTPSAGVLKSGGVLGDSQTLESAPLDRILNVLTPSIRKKVEVDLQSLGAGLNNEGTNLNQFLGATQPAVQNGTQILGILNAQKQQVADVVQNAGTVFHSLADRTGQLEGLIRSGITTAQAVASRDTALSQSFADLPATLMQAKTSLNVLNGFAGAATPTVANLRVAVVKLNQPLHELAPTAADASKLFRILPNFLQKANPLLTHLKMLTTMGEPTIPALDSMMQQTDPLISYLRPYYRDIGSFLMNFGGTAQYETQQGIYLGRCTCPLSADSYANYTPQEQALVQALIKAGGLGGIANPGTSGLRAPGTEPNASTNYTGSYPHVTALAPAKLKK